MIIEKLLILFLGKVYNNMQLKELKRILSKYPDNKCGVLIEVQDETVKKTLDFNVFEDGQNLVLVPDYLLFQR